MTKKDQMVIYYFYHLVICCLVYRRKYRKTFKKFYQIEFLLENNKIP